MQCKLPNDHDEQADPMDMEQIKVCVEMFTCTELLYPKTRDIFFICPACLSISLPDRISAVVKKNCIIVCRIIVRDLWVGVPINNLRASLQNFEKFMTFWETYQVTNLQSLCSAMFRMSIKNSDICHIEYYLLDNLNIQFWKIVTQSGISSIYKLDNSLSHGLILSLLGIPCHVILLKIEESGIIRKHAKCKGWTWTNRIISVFNL